MKVIRNEKERYYIALGPGIMWSETLTPEISPYLGVVAFVPLMVYYVWPGVKYLWKSINDNSSSPGSSSSSPSPTENKVSEMGSDISSISSENVLESAIESNIDEIDDEVRALDWKMRQCAANKDIQYREQILLDAKLDNKNKIIDYEFLFPDKSYPEYLSKDSLEMISYEYSNSEFIEKVATWLDAKIFLSLSGAYYLKDWINVNGEWLTEDDLSSVLVVEHYVTKYFERIINIILG